MKQIVIQSNRQTAGTSAALLEDGSLMEYYKDRSQEKPKAGDVYVGRVMNVLQGMQAAFVHIGQEKNAFLYIDDLLPAHLEKQPKVKPQINELVHAGQNVIVQMTKEPIGDKGARVTTHYSIPGRWIVYMPDADYVGVSRKIESDSERSRLKDIVDSIREPGEGLIIRTIAAGSSLAELQHDLQELRDIWASVMARSRNAPAPSRIFTDLSLIPRLVRDIVNEKIDEIIVDSPQIRGEIAAMLGEVSPGMAEKVRLHTDRRQVFEHYEIDKQLNRSLQRKIWLPSGGHLIIDLTEALTVIDINTGKFTGSVDLEQTVFETNSEAAVEIARLLRLRDVGGIIIIDFIDMELEEHRQRVLQRLSDELKKDRTKSTVVGWTKLGLVEMTRKKVRDTSDELAEPPSPAGSGTGKAQQRDFRY